MLLFLLACGAPSPDPLDSGPACDPDADLDAVRAATEAYADVALAEGDGYASVDDVCELDASGAAMGIHYVRLADSLDQEHDLLQPEVLLYVPEGDGLRLVGVEYVRPALIDGEMVFGGDEPDGTFEPPPELFCRPFDGPMAGHVAAQPWHYDLHVWLFSDNPEGLYAPYNPAEDCAP